MADNFKAVRLLRKKKQNLLEVKFSFSRSLSRQPSKFARKAFVILPGRYQTYQKTSNESQKLNAGPTPELLVSSFPCLCQEIWKVAVRSVLNAMTETVGKENDLCPDPIKKLSWNSLRT